MLSLVSKEREQCSMANLCRDLKIEYKHLKTLNTEFVSACEKAGDPRALSAEQLRTLQTQKQKLETARDHLYDVLEPKETRMWKKLWNMTQAAVIESEDSRYVQMTVAEILQDGRFRKDVVDTTRSLVSRGTSSDGRSARSAAIWFSSAADLDLLQLTEGENQWVMLRDEVKKTTHSLSTYIKGDVESGEKDEIAAWQGVTGFLAARQFGLIDLYDRIRIEDKIVMKEYRDELIKGIFRNAHLGEVAGKHAAEAVVGFSAASELELLDVKVRDDMIEMMERDDLQKTFIAHILKGVYVFSRGALDPTEVSPIEVLSAMQRLIKLSRRWKPKQPS